MTLKISKYAKMIIGLLVTLSIEIAYSASNINVLKNGVKSYGSLEKNQMNYYQFNKVPGATTIILRSSSQDSSFKIGQTSIYISFDYDDKKVI